MGIPFTKQNLFRWILISGVFILLGLYLYVENSFTSRLPLQIKSSRPRSYDVCGKDHDPFAQMLATRIRQYGRFWNDHPDFKPKKSLHHDFYATRNLTMRNLGYDPGADVENMTYTVEKMEKNGSIILIVEEIANGKPSNGGSSFYGLANTTDMVYMCGYDDLFNGTYVIQCGMYSQCAHFTIKLAYVTFKQYQGVTKRQDVVIFSREICLQNACHHPRKPTEHWQKSRGNSKASREKEKYTWFSKKQWTNYPLDDRTFCGLVDRMIRDRFYMVGSSHMANQHWYILILCSPYLPQLRTRLIYIPARFGHNVISAIEKFIGRNTTANATDATGTKKDATGITNNTTRIINNATRITKNTSRATKDTTGTAHYVTRTINNATKNAISTTKDATQTANNATGITQNATGTTNNATTITTVTAKNVTYATNNATKITKKSTRNTKKCRLPKPKTRYTCKSLLNLKPKRVKLKRLGRYASILPCPYDRKFQTGMLFQIGSWDLSYNGLKASLDNLLPRLNDTLRHLGEFQRANPSVNIAAMSPPPTYGLRYAETRNNDVIQIFGRAFGEVLARHGVRYLDGFHAMYPLYDHTPPDDSHYIHCKGSKCNHTDTGLVVLHRAVKSLALPCL